VRHRRPRRWAGDHRRRVGRRPDHRGDPEGARIIVGADFAWKSDTTAIVPLHEQGGGRLLVGKPTILTPPRDGTQLPVDEVKQAFSDLHRANPIEAVVMDMSRAEDVAQWITDAIGCDVYDRSQGNAHAVSDFDSMTKALRGGRLKHNGDPELRRHVLNAIARRLPGGDLRFERPSSSRHAVGQDRRVIDGLTALAMAVEHVGSRPPKTELLGWL
jgi:phage terminase large subunit-like protein